MALGIRKILVIGLIGAIFIAGNVVLIANWLAENGISEKANWVRENFLTGTAIAVIVALLILLVNPKSNSRSIGFIRRCPVCDHRLMGSPNYCGDCGSKVS